MSQAAQLTSALSAQAQYSPELESRQGLEQAFSLFNQMSAQLTDSYGLLEARVTELKGELAHAGAQRLQELAEKERLASACRTCLICCPVA
ncbi:FleS [Pseudomonas savastanoi]|uniref:FleS n=1 Tax=Pseudomonas savastanoi TaxID=29438 RepID=A0A3M5FCB8_PSESS|nr:FleS [Pseudomonas savastanoi]